MKTNTALPRFCQEFCQIQTKQEKKRENIYTIPVDYCAQSLVHSTYLVDKQPKKKKKNWSNEKQSNEAIKIIFFFI